MDINIGKILQTATETVKGVVELATSAEVLAGVDTERAVTPAGLKEANTKYVDAALALKADLTYAEYLMMEGDPA